MACNLVSLFYINNNNQKKIFKKATATKEKLLTLMKMVLTEFSSVCLQILKAYFHDELNLILASDLSF